MNKPMAALSILLCFTVAGASAQEDAHGRGHVHGRSTGARCSGLPTAGQLKQFLVAAPSHDGEAGGLFHGTRMRGAVVNRNGELCEFATSKDDPTQVWPGSQAIARAKAYTANAFSLDGLALSTARLYTLTQPGHSLFGLNNSNPFNPALLTPPMPGAGAGTTIAGGIITFGGGVGL